MANAAARPKLLLAAAIVLFLVALPFLRFYADHSDETFKHLRILDSVWTLPISMDEKINRLVNEFAFGLSPNYWYAPENSRDLIRHQMKGYGLLLPITLPLTILGLLQYPEEIQVVAVSRGVDCAVHRADWRCAGGDAGPACWSW